MNNEKLIKLPKQVEEMKSQMETVTSNIEININDFPKLPNEFDDTQRLQRAINSLVYGGTLIIKGILRISSQITINRTGIKLKGSSNKKSKIICDVEGVAIFVKILLESGQPYTNMGYCKFFIDDIALIGVGKSVNGTGLWLQWIYASSFKNLYTSGFKNHVMLKGSHLNSFYNLYCGGHNEDTTSPIFNKSCGISGDGNLDETGESSSNNNSFVGGVLHNCTFDLRAFGECKFDGLDVEPAGWTCYLGDTNSIINSRLERFDISEVNGNSHYGLFKWIEIGEKCTIKNTTFHQSGACATENTPILDVLGNYNDIDVKGNIHLANLVRFGDNTYSNKINIYHVAEILNQQQQAMNGMFKGNNIIKFVNEKETSSIPWLLSLTQLNNNGCEISTPTELPSKNLLSDYYLTLKNGVLAHFNTSIFNAMESGLYTLNMWVNVKTTLIIQYNLSKEGLKLGSTNGWKFISIPLLLKGGDVVSPVFGTGANTESSIGGIFVCKGVGKPYINDDVKKGFVITSNLGALIKQGTKFTITIKNADSSKTCSYKGVWGGSETPQLYPISKDGISIDLVNAQGSIGLNIGETVNVLMEYEYVI